MTSTCACGQRRHPHQGGRVRPGVSGRQPLDSRRAGRRHAHRGRPGAAHRRLQDGPTAADGRLTDLRGFARLGDEGVDLFMADSTNAETPGFTTHERDIEPAMERVFASAKQKLIVACFASHVHRVQQVMDAAVRHGRKVVYIGRSMVRNMTVAQELGYLRVPANTLIDLKQPRELSRRQGRDDLDRVAGRTAVGAVADQQPRASGGHRRARRRGAAGVVADSATRTRSTG